jgi:hypothetical protein
MHFYYQHGVKFHSLRWADRRIIETLSLKLDILRDYVSITDPSVTREARDRARREYALGFGDKSEVSIEEYLKNIDAKRGRAPAAKDVFVTKITNEIERQEEIQEIKSVMERIYKTVDNFEKAPGLTVKEI